MPVSPTERRAYVRKIREISKRFDRLEDDTIRRMIAMIDDARKSIAAELLSGPSEFDALRLQQLSENMTAITGALEAQIISESQATLTRAWQLGQAFTVEPIEAAGLYALFNSPSLSQVNVLLDFSADLIRGIMAETLQKINAQIRIGALGVRTPFAIMQEVTRILGIKAGREIVGGVAARAETIVRTETNRAFSIANNSQRDIVAQEVPGVQKEWMATGDFRTRAAHLAAHGQVVDYDKPFIVGGEKMMHTHDPQASGKNTINCRCRDITIHPEVGRVTTPVDEQIEAEKERRQGEMAPFGVPKFATLKEAQKWAIDNIGLASADYTMALDLAQDLNERLYWAKQNGYLGNLTSIVRDKDAAAYMSIREGAELRIGKLISSFQGELIHETALKNGRQFYAVAYQSSPQKLASIVIDHEIGHLVQTQAAKVTWFENEYQRGARKAFRAWEKAVDAARAGGFLPSDRALMNEVVKDRRLGGFMYEEAFAEVFAAYHNGIPVDQSLIDAMIDITNINTSVLVPRETIVRDVIARSAK